MTFDPWGAPSTAPVAGWTAVPEPRPSRRRADLITFGGVVIAMLLLAAPVGLLWSALAPHYTVVLDKGQLTTPNIESTKAFIGADGSYALVMAGAGLVCGGLAWWWARKGGPFTVVALVLGGILASLIAGSVGLMPGRQASFDALKATKGDVQLYLGKRDDKSDDVHLRSPWAGLAWPVAALIAFVGPAFVRPEELD